MKKFTRIALVTSIVATASVALASNWVTVGVLHEGKCTLTYRIDTATWSHDGHIVKAWDNMQYGPNQASCPVGNPKEFRALQLWNCKDHTSQLRAIWREDWNGNIHSSTIDDQPWEAIVPDTLADDELNYVCSHNPDADK